ncbi:MAG: hypothetical protein NZ529_10340 [Cytophagaceae bacterium]|nr:hypothetical protein [Cytophagaceae bacterium]MDW8457184.1 hypothetical protein [Cytophagaceae bacterium]
MNFIAYTYNIRVKKCTYPYDFLFLLSPYLTAQTDVSFPTELVKCYGDVMKLKLSVAASSLSFYKRKYGEDIFCVYLENYCEAIKLFISEDEQDYKSLKKNEALRIAKIATLQKSNKTNPYSRFLQAEIRMHWAILNLKFGEEVNAALGIKQAYKLLQENQKLYPGFVPNFKSLGFIHILSGSLPEQYQWAIKLIGMEGNINKGLDMLTTVSLSDTPFRLEASLLKVIAENYIIGTEGSSSISLQKLYEENKDNLLIHILYSALLMKTSQSSRAIEILNSRPKGSEYIAVPQLQLYLGDAYLQKGEYENSRKHYLEFLSDYKGKNSIKDSYYKIFLSYWLQDKEAEAMKYFDQITKVGKEAFDSDKYAQRMAKNRELPEKTLTKIRLYTDGGFFEKAYELEKNISVSTFQTKKNKLEYYYRMARLYHKSGRIQSAETYYMKTIELTTDESYYFAPNSALQLGYIYFALNETEKAKLYFRKALAYKNYEYKNSIDNKAKAMLNKIK